METNRSAKGNNKTTANVVSFNSSSSFSSITKFQSNQKGRRGGGGAIGFIIAKMRFRNERINQTLCLFKIMITLFVLINLALIFVAAIEATKHGVYERGTNRTNTTAVFDAIGTRSTSHVRTMAVVLYLAVETVLKLAIIMMTLFERTYVLACMCAMCVILIVLYGWTMFAVVPLMVAALVTSFILWEFLLVYTCLLYLLEKRWQLQ